MEKAVNLNIWKRREHFEFFKKMDYPQYNIGKDLEKTPYLKFIKEKGNPFTLQ